MRLFTDPHVAAENLFHVFTQMHWSWRTDGRPPAVKEIETKFAKLYRKLQRHIAAYPNGDEKISICEGRLAVTATIENGYLGGTIIYSLDVESMAEVIAWAINQ